jgi:hypothetical protein
LFSGLEDIIQHSATGVTPRESPKTSAGTRAFFLAIVKSRSNMTMLAWRTAILLLSVLCLFQGMLVFDFLILLLSVFFSKLSKYFNWYSQNVFDQQERLPPAQPVITALQTRHPCLVRRVHSVL